MLQQSAILWFFHVALRHRNRAGPVLAALDVKASRIGRANERNAPAWSTRRCSCRGTQLASLLQQQQQQQHRGYSFMMIVELLSTWRNVLPASSRSFCCCCWDDAPSRIWCIRHAATEPAVIEQAAALAATTAWISCPFCSLENVF